MDDAVLLNIALDIIDMPSGPEEVFTLYVESRWLTSSSVHVIPSRVEGVELAGLLRARFMRFGLDLLKHDAKKDTLFPWGLR